MKQIHKAVQALETDIGFWRPSWILLKTLRNDEKNVQGKFSRASMHTANTVESRYNAVVGVQKTGSCYKWIAQ